MCRDHMCSRAIFLSSIIMSHVFFFFQAEDGIRDYKVTGVQTCAFFFQAEDGIRDYKVTSSDVCSSDLAAYPQIDPCRGCRFWLPSCPREVVMSTRLAVAVLALAACVSTNAALLNPSLKLAPVCPDEIGRASCRERV